MEFFNDFFDISVYVHLQPARLGDLISEFISRYLFILYIFGICAMLMFAFCLISRISRLLVDFKDRIQLCYLLNNAMFFICL